MPMPMKIAEDYKRLKMEAEAVLKGRLDDMTEEEIAYNNILPQYDARGKINPHVNSYNQELMTSRYFPVNYQVTVDTYVESMVNNMPFIEFDTSRGEATGDEATAINRIFRTTALADDFFPDMASVLRNGIRKGICACELVPYEKKISGYALKDGKMQPFDQVYKGHFKLIRYNPETTLIDPNADPDRIQETASYIIVEHGVYSEEMFDKVMKENGWDYDKNEVKASNYREPRVDYVRKIEGVGTDSKNFKISKVFYADGMVDVVVNDTYLVSHKLNAKALKEMPLIIYVSYAGGNTPYGRMIWCLQRQGIYGLAATLNLSLDAIGKNINGPKFTTLSDLANRDVRSFGKNRFVFVNQRLADGRKLADEIFQPQYTDITQGSVNLQNQFRSDIQQTGRISALDMGSQGTQQVRTDGIAQAMSGSMITKQSAFVKQAEQTFFRTFARHWWWILLSRYGDFDELKGEKQPDGSVKGGIPRELLADIKAIRIKNGSTLPEDQMSNLQRLITMLEIIMKTGSESGYDTTEILDSIFENMGIPNTQRFKLDTPQAIAKHLMLAGIPPELAIQGTQKFLAQMQQVVQAQPKPKAGA